MVVTGANSGIGLGAVRSLVRSGCDVVMACRNLVKAESAASAVRSEYPSATIRVEQLDLADLESVRALVDRLADSAHPIDVLMNNAGVMAVDRSTTRQGFEMQLGTNHLGHFALTGLMLPLLDASGGRIVNVSSLGHRLGSMKFDDPMSEQRRYSRWGAYFDSKLANLLFTRELDRRLRAAGSRVDCLAAHPGTASTELGKVGDSATNKVMRTFAPVLVRDGERGATAQVRAALDRSLAGGHFVGPRWWFFGQPVVEKPCRRARRDDDARRLWSISEEATGVVYPF